MSVVLNKLTLYNFRNHSSFVLDQPKKTVIIIGRNAAGKTNIVEAVQLISRMDSFRHPKWPTVVKSGEDVSFIQADFSQNERLLTIKMDIQEGRRSYSLNDKKRNRSSMMGLVPAVLFVPDDLSLIKESSEARRNLIDELGEQLSPTYRKITADYQKIVKQRNSLLKEQKENGVCSLVQESWDDNLIQIGALLFTHRLRLYKKILDKATLYYQELSQGEELTGVYIPSFFSRRNHTTITELTDLTKEVVEELLRQTLEEVRTEEWSRAKTLVGPHRDEILFFIDKYEVRQYGSQGQQRSIALSLKLAELAVVQEISGNQPLLLLDDVMSELDERRRTALIKVIDGDLQTFITATDLSCFNETVLKNAQIINLDNEVY
jgi:DNA replication and repair protein RecF